MDHLLCYRTSCRERQVIQALGTCEHALPRHDARSAVSACGRATIDYSFRLQKKWLAGCTTWTGENGRVFSTLSERYALVSRLR